MSDNMKYEIPRTNDNYEYKFMSNIIDRKPTKHDSNVPVELLVFYFMVEMASRYPASSIIFEVHTPNSVDTRLYDIRWVARFPNIHIDEDSLKLIETLINNLEYNCIILDKHPDRKIEIFINTTQCSFETNLLKMELPMSEQMSLIDRYLYEFEACGISKEIIQIALSSFLKRFAGLNISDSISKKISDYIESLISPIWSKAYTLNLAHLALMTNPHLHHPDAHYLDLYKTTMDHESDIEKIGYTLSTLAEKEQKIMQEISDAWPSSTEDVGKIVAKIESEGGVYDVD